MPRSRDTIVSRAKLMRSINEAFRVPIYASRTVESNSNYQISITAERIEFLLGLIDRTSLNYIKKVSLFLRCVIYKRRYHDAKSKYGNFHLKNVFNYHRHQHTCTPHIEKENVQFLLSTEDYALRY